VLKPPRSGTTKGVNGGFGGEGSPDVDLGFHKEESTFPRTRRSQKKTTRSRRESVLVYREKGVGASLNIG